jgi:Raf kinase inhibitor-like YbhB/YbcL family protein
MKAKLLTTLVATPLALSAGALVAMADTPSDMDNVNNELHVTSGMFKDGGTLPESMSCDGGAVPPMLTWSGAPDKTKSFAVEVRDLDSKDGKFTHWIVSGIAKNVSAIGGVPEGAVAGLNSNGDNGWAAVCPPAGQTHRYEFTVYALDKNIESRDFNMGLLDSAMKGHVLGSGSIVGSYRRGGEATGGAMQP